MKFIFIEKGKSFTIINSSNIENLTLICLKEKGSIFNFQVLRKYAGTLLYLTKNGFLKNNNFASNYILNEFDGDYIKDLYLDKNKGLYKELVSLPEKFNFLKNNKE